MQYLKQNQKPTNVWLCNSLGFAFYAQIEEFFYSLDFEQITLTTNRCAVHFYAFRKTFERFVTNCWKNVMTL